MAGLITKNPFISGLTWGAVAQISAHPGKDLLGMNAGFGRPGPHISINVPEGTRCP